MYELDAIIVLHLVSNRNTQKEITLDLLPDHCNRQGLFLCKGGFHLWLTSLSSDLEKP